MCSRRYTWQNEVIRICLSCHRSHGCRTTTSCAPFGTCLWVWSKKIPYSGKLEGENFRELVKNMIFAEKTFADCSYLLRQRRPRPKVCAEKTFAYSHKTAKFAKFFSLEGFPLYGRSETVAVDVQCVVDETNVLIALE